MVYVFFNINISVTPLPNHESLNFDILWIKIFLPVTAIILCFCHCCFNKTDLKYITTPHKTFTSPQSNSELFCLENFNVHCLRYPHINAVGKKAKTFRILKNLEQPVKEFTHIPNCLNQFLNTFDMIHRYSFSLKLYCFSSYLQRWPQSCRT